MAGPGMIRRLSEEIKRVVGRIVAMELKDPRVGIACVVAVDLSADLGYAKIYVRILGDEEETRSAMEGLQNATGHIRSELGDRTRLKYIPEISFHLDETAEHAERIEELLRRIHHQEDSPDGEEGGR